MTPIQVLVVDDSALMRNLITRIINSSPELQVVGTAMNGKFAVQKIPRLKPEFIILDLEMPEMNGIEFLRKRKELGIDIPVVILSSIARKGAQVTMEALSLGASDFIMKPSGSISEDIHVVAENIIGMAKAYGGQYRRQHGEPTDVVAPPKRISVETPQPRFTPKPAPLTSHKAEKITPLRSPGKVEIIAIGISTGGPNALRQVFGRLKADINVPIVVVQHMPAGFTEEFAKSLDKICPLEVKEAEDGDIVKPGRVLIAPGNYHIEVEKKSLASIVHVTSDDPENGHRPSADVLFRSIAKSFGNNAMGVIMTGMGRDGAKELGSIYREGGITIGQNQESCIVYGMPKVAYEYGYVMKQVALEDMADVIYENVKGQTASV